MKIFSFLRLIRLQNLLMIIFMYCIIKFFLINQFIAEPALNNFNFFLFLLSTVLISAAGYVINDIYDVKIDQINKNNDVIINTKIKSSQALISYLILNFFSFVIIAYVSIQIGKPIFSLIFLYSIFILWRYSKELKKKFARGNVVVSWLIALSIINIGLFDVLPVMTKDNSSPIVFKIIMAFSLFAFLTNLSREIIKDVEDEEGDKQLNANTLIIKFGLKKTKQVINFLNVSILVLIGLWQYFQYSFNQTSFENNQKIEIWGTDINSIFYTFALQILVLFLIFKTFFAKSKNDFSFLSQLSKFIMIFGILSILIFTKNYF